MKGKAEKQKTSSDEWETPGGFFEYWNSIYHFDMDVAAQAHNAKLVYYSSNSLNPPWAKRNWCNPPFSRKWDFIEKAVREAMMGKLTAMLLPASTGPQWFYQVVKHAEKISFIVGRIRFVGAPSSADFDICVALFTEEGLSKKVEVEWVELKKEDRR